jgi:hypothetical protein
MRLNRTRRQTMPDLDDIRETVRLMRERNQTGQGTTSSAMCRLSLGMSERLLTEIERLQREVEDRTDMQCDQTMGADCEITAGLRAEVERLREALGALLHQAGEERWDRSASPDTRLAYETARTALTEPQKETDDG